MAGPWLHVPCACCAGLSAGGLAGSSGAEGKVHVVVSHGPIVIMSTMGTVPGPSAFACIFIGTSMATGGVLLGVFLGVSVSRVCCRVLGVASG